MKFNKLLYLPVANGVFGAENPLKPKREEGEYQSRSSLCAYQTNSPALKSNK